MIEVPGDGSRAGQLARAGAPESGTTDDLTRQLRRAQEALRRRAFGVCGGVVLRSGVDEEGAGEWQESLCFGKIDGEWRLYLQSGFVDDPSAFMKRDLFTANIETRLIAAKKIPVLVRALEAVEGERAEDVARVTKELQKYLDHWLRTGI